MDILGVYAVTLSLAVAPISPLMQTVGTPGFLILARSRDTPKRYLETYLWLTWFFAFLAFGYAAFIGLTLDVLVPFVFGKAYTVGTDTVFLISAIVFLRILRAGGPRLSVLAGVLFGDVLTIVLLQWAAIAGIPNEVGSL
jgi:hypothetical protein